MQLYSSIGYKTITKLLLQKKFTPFAFQTEAWQKINKEESGLVNAPTGCGKTYAVFLGAVIKYINQHPKDFKKLKNNGLQLLWVTPLKALAKDIARAMQEVIDALGMPWKVGIRNGDTDTNERQKQKRHTPEILLITPESLHLFLAQKNNSEIWNTLQVIAVDEWHELMGSKRGVQVELAISRIVGVKKQISIWGISATIGNLEQAADCLLYSLQKKYTIVKANLDKKISIECIMPDTMEKFPWAGHLGIKLIEKVVPIIEDGKTTLLFINTRGMSEMWYQSLLDIAPQLAGAIALHHGSIEKDLRLWVEEALHTGILKVVVCTASLDLGVDFRPVETVIQVGSPKGIARFLQRAGRSGHQPDAVSKIYFLPTHSLELLEAVALQNAVQEKDVESKEALFLCYDVLVQYLCTLAVGEGFEAEIIFKEVKNTFCFNDITWEDFVETIQYITQGGKALQEYDEFKKVEYVNGLYVIKNRRTAMQHRLHIGTIVSDTMLKVKFVTGGYIGVIEEWFISKLTIGDSFTLAGRNLELVSIKDMTVSVRKSSSKKSIIPSWMGGRMSLSANLGKRLRAVLNTALQINANTPKEIIALQPLLQLQNEMSIVPKENEFLMEHIETKDGYHLFVYSFEGRMVNEAMAAILGYRLSKIIPITFSFAMNDYGFELLSDQPIPLDDSNVYELFSTENLFADIQHSVNSTEMAKRKFRDIAVIGGLIFQGYPGEQKKARHLQSSASLLYKVLSEYEPNNLLLKQAYTEVFNQQMEEARLREMLNRIAASKIIITYPKQLTPFCFPIKVDSIRESMSSEKLADRVRRMQLEASK
jgi:ATP-dependent Lhr-like helicase